MQQVLLGAMSRAELESTIVEPAKMAGLTFNPARLVSNILDEAGEDEGMLPLLQHALKETWELREGGVITAYSYARSGGVREAIRLTAERTFDELSPDDQQAARKLFLRLVTPGEGQEDTRARATIPDEPRLRKIVDRFAGPRARLLVTGSDRADRPIVEVAHEALIRTWPRLRDWIDASRDKLRARAAIVQAKAVWEEQGRREDLLLPAGFQLERARTLVADPGDITIDDLKAFIEQSEAAEARRRDKEASRERQHQMAELEASRRVARRTRAGLVAALALAAVVIGIGIYARSQTAEAEANFREGQKTESYFRAEQAKQAGADAVTAALLALEGLRDSASADEVQRTRPFVNEAWRALYAAHHRQRERAVLSGHTGAATSAVFAGAILVAASRRKRSLPSCMIVASVFLKLARSAALVDLLASVFAGLLSAVA